MIAIVSMVAFLGLEARAVEAQVKLAPGLPAFIVGGLPDKAVAESRERVRSALAASNAALACARAPRCAADYQAKFEGRLLDRIDLHVEVRAVSAAADLVLPPLAEGSAEVSGRVAEARALQTERYEVHNVRTNAEADGELLDRVTTPDEAGRALLAQVAEAMRLSARGHHRVLRVAHSGGPCRQRGRWARPYRRGFELPAEGAGPLNKGTIRWIG